MQMHVDTRVKKTQKSNVAGVSPRLGELYVTHPAGVVRG